MVLILWGLGFLWGCKMPARPGRYMRHWGIAFGATFIGVARAYREATGSRATR